MSQEENHNTKKCRTNFKFYGKWIHSWFGPHAGHKATPQSHPSNSSQSPGEEGKGQPALLLSHSNVIRGISFNSLVVLHAAPREQDLQVNAEWNLENKGPGIRKELRH